MSRVRESEQQQRGTQIPQKQYDGKVIKTKDCQHNKGKRKKGY